MAGDHKQLPPTIMSRDAARRGLEQTLMERVIKMLGDKVVHMLTTQYRYVYHVLFTCCLNVVHMLYECCAHVDVHVVHELIVALFYIIDISVSAKLFSLEVK